MSEDEYNHSTKRFNIQRQSLKEDIAKIESDAYTLEQNIHQVLELQNELKQNTALLRQKIQHKQEEKNNAKEKASRLRDHFFKLSTKSKEITQEHDNNIILLKAHQTQLDSCTQTVEIQRGKRQRLLKEALISSILWGHKLALINAKQYEQAMKRIGRDIGISVVLWGCGVGLAHKSAQVSAAAAKWIYRLVSSAQGPVSNLMSDNFPKRMQQVVELHVQYCDTFLNGYTTNEIESMLKTLQPDADTACDLAKWASDSPENLAIFELCSQRIENNLQQDLRSDFNEKAPIFLAIE